MVGEKEGHIINVSMMLAPYTWHLTYQSCGGGGGGLFLLAMPTNLLS